MAAPLTLHLLGGASIEGPDGPVTGRAAQRHRLALLALLAATPRGMSRDKVVALLWPEREAARARHALSDSIYRINKAVEGEVVVANGGRDLRLDADALPSDLGAFRRALAEEDWERAVDAWGGAFLDGFHLSGSTEFERWVDGERRRLGRRYAEALEALARERAEDADLKGAAATWRRRAVLDPYDSWVAVRLMEALEAAGNPAAALRHAREHTELMEGEFGAGPDPEVAALAERIREGARSGSGRATDSPQDASGATSPGSSRGRGPPGDVPAPDVSEDTPSAPDPGGPRAKPPPRSTPAPARSPGRREREAPEAASHGSRERAWSAWRRVGIGAAALLAATLAAIWIPGAASPPSGQGPIPPGRSAAPGTSAGGEALSMAVLLFEDLSPEGDQESFAWGIAEEIAQAVDELPGVGVIGPSSSFVFRDKALDVRQIADTLGVDVLLAGSLRAGGDSVWISAHLVDGTTGFRRWDETYATAPTASRLRATQHRIAREVAAALSLRVGHEPPSAGAAVSDRAYDAYLEGRAVLRRFQSGAVSDAREVLNSLDYFEEVVDLEPEWADGWAGLGEAHHWAAYAGFERQRHWTASKRALERAVVLDPDHARANASLGFVLHRLDHDYEAAEARLRRALDLDTWQYWHCGYSFFLLWAGRYDEAVEATRRTEAHNPMSWRRKALTVSSERCAGRFEEAVRRAERVLSETPGAGGVRRDLALALQRTGRVEAALEALEETEGAGAYLDLVRVLVLARSGRADEAESLLRRVDLHEATRWARDWYPVQEVRAEPLHAAALIALGRPDAAVEVLQAAMDRDPDTLIYDRCYPELGTLEEDPRYRELLRRTGVPGW